MSANTPFYKHLRKMLRKHPDRRVPLRVARLALRARLARYRMGA